MQLDRDLAYALKPSLWASECLGFHADEWQAEVLDGNGKKALLCCSRQSGKSSVSFHPGIAYGHLPTFKPDIDDLTKFAPIQ